MGFVGILILRSELSNTEFTKKYPAEQLEVLKSSITDFSLFILVLHIVVLLLIIIFSFINFKAVNNNDSINLFPYYLGAALSILLIIQQIFYQFLSVSTFIQLFILALYYFVYHYANIFNKRDIDVIEGELN